VLRYVPRLADQVAVHESAIGPKRTWARALHMSAFGGKAHIGIGGQNVRF
jgi:hypothetical protein